MPSYIAVFVFAVGIIGLFALERDGGTRTSKALWIPVAWLFINSSRPVSAWLGVFGLGSQYIDPAQVYLEGSPADRNAYMFLLFAGLIVIAARSQRVGPMFHRMGMIMLFFSYCALSVLWSDYPFVAFKHWTKGIGDVVMVLVVLTDPEPVAAIKRLFSRIGFVLIPLSVLFIKYIPDLGRVYTVGGASESTGVATQKNSLGIMCLVFGLGSLWHFLTVYRNHEVARRTRLLIAHGAILAMVLWLLRTCDSMTSFSCFLMGGAVMILASQFSLARRTAVVHLLVVAMIGFSLFALFLDSGGSLLANMGRNPTLTGRTEIWKAVLSLAGNPLIGTGYESFWIGERLQKLWTVDGGAFLGINEAHNGYLELYLNLGWIGLALLVGLIVTGYRTVIATFREEPGAGSLGVALFVASLAYNFTEAGFRMMSPLWILFLLAIMGVPNAPAPQCLSVNGADLSQDVAANEPERKYAFGARLRSLDFQGAIDRPFLQRSPTRGYGGPSRD